MRNAVPRYWLCLLVLLLTGCSDLTPYRTTSFLLAPSPPVRVGTLAEDRSTELTFGAYQVAGNLDGLLFISDPTLGLVFAVDGSDYGNAGDPGILRAVRGGHVSVRRGFGSHFEFGGTIEVATTQDAVKSRIGVLPLRNASVASKFGPTMGLQFPLGDDGLKLVVRGEFAFTSVPYSRYRLKSNYQDLAGTQVSGDGSEYYELEETGSELMPLFSLTTALAMRGESLEGALGFTVGSQLTNDGFSYAPLPPVETGPPGLFVTGEIGWRLNRNVRLNLQSWVQSSQGTDHYNATPIGSRLTLTLMTAPPRAALKPPEDVPPEARPTTPAPVDTGSAEPKTAESDAIESDEVEPDEVESDEVESDVVESDVVESDVVESDVVESDVVKSEATDADASEGSSDED